MRQALALQPSPGVGGIHGVEIVVATQLMREFEMVEDTKNSLGYAHCCSVQSRVGQIEIQYQSRSCHPERSVAK